MKTLINFLCMTIFIAGSVFADKPKTTEHENSLLNAPGEIRGQVIDAETNKGKPFASVSLENNGHVITGTTTDVNGYYKLKPVDVGTYTVKFSHLGYQAKEISKVEVYTSQITYLNVTIISMSHGIPPITIEEPGRHLVDPGFCGKIEIITDTEIKTSGGGRDVVSLVFSRSSEAKPSKNGKQASIRGSRFGSTQYIVDGIKMIGSLNLPQTAIEQVTVWTGGIPAQYGDATGGFVIITTKSYNEM